LSTHQIHKKLFSERLKELMDSNNENTYTLAELLHLTPATISRYTTGDISPKITTIQVIANYFKINPAWLMGYDVDKNAYQQYIYGLDVGGVNDSTTNYYINDETRQMAQEIYDNPDLRILFDATRKITTEDIKAVIEIVNRMRGRNS